MAPTREEVEAYRSASAAEASTLASTAVAVERERPLRTTLVADLRGGLWREALGVVLLVVGVVASALADLL
jgi:hypothetical protein